MQATVIFCGWVQSTTVISYKKPNYFNFPELPQGVTGKQINKWRYLAMSRLRDREELVQGGESKFYLQNLDQYRLEFQAEQDYRVMQGVAVIAIASPIIIMATPELLAFLNDAQFETYIRATDFLNTTRLGLSQTIITLLGSNASLTTIQNLRNWGDTNTDPVKLYKELKALYDFYDNLKKATK